MATLDNIIAERVHPAIDFSRSYLDLIYISKVLAFNMQAQTQTQWCWAATSTSVSRFYSIFSPWTQCKVASQAMGETCCATPVPGPCNQPWYLNLALDITGNFVSYQGGTITWSQIRDELDKGLVVGARIGWSGGGGHFMVIHGVSKQGATEYLHIDDPIYGKSTLTYQTFATNYQGSGTWTHTYFTKKKFYLMWYKHLILQSKLLEPIFKARPLLDVHGYRGDLAQAVPESAFSTAHYNYVLGLNDIGRTVKLPEKPASLRVLETEADTVVALYEVDANADKPDLIGIQRDQALFEAMDRGLAALKDRAGGTEEQPELRSLRVPALNIEALWLHYPEGGKDAFRLMRSFETPGFDANTVYDEAEFKKLLTSAAASLQGMDDEKGA